MSKLAILFFSLFPILLMGQTSIYDIQYTTIPGDGSYPSLYEGQTVTTGGIVTVADFDGGRYFISSSQGGPWNGLFVYDNHYTPAVGDSILITGQVYEYRGMTEIKDLSSFTVVSTSNPLPEYTAIHTSEISGEAWEGVPVEITSCEALSGYDDYGGFQVDDGSAAGTVRAGRYNLEADGFPMVEGFPFASIKGIVTDYYGPCLLPGSYDDYRSEPGALVMATEEQFVDEQGVFEVPVKIALLSQSENIATYHLEMTFDHSVLNYQGYETEGTLSGQGEITDNSGADQISILFDGASVCDRPATLICLKFTPENSGNGNLQFQSSLINDSGVALYATGDIVSGAGQCNTAQADTLTIVQRPLLNIPSIVTPGESFMIECFAPANTTGWNAGLTFADLEIELSIVNADYNSTLDK